MRRSPLSLPLAVVGAILATVVSAGTVAADAPTVQPPVHVAYLTALTTTYPVAWVAGADGRGARRLGSHAWDTTMAPNGASVALVTPLGRNGTSLVLAPTAAGGKLRTIAHASESIFQVAWSPDSMRIVAVLNGNRLIVVDVATGATHLVARGQFQGVSFAPGSDRIAYGRSASPSLSARVDVIVADADGTHRHAITHDGRSLYPLWGPTRIAFTHERLRRNDAPIFQLWLMGPDGHGIRHLTHLRIPKLLSGLTATAWSDDGTRLLAEYGGQDTSEAWTVDVGSGRARDLTGRVDSVAGRGLSHDGRTVLVQRGFFDDPAHQSVATIPFGGGHVTVLVRHGGSPSWNR